MVPPIDFAGLEPEQPEPIAPGIYGRLSEARDMVRDRQIALVHYGENTPLDEGYRPIRMGLLAKWLTEAGARVVRFTPSFSSGARYQRPTAWSGTETEEGTIEVIPTRSFPHSRSRQRIGFIYDLATGTATRIRTYPDVELVIVGYPPPGLLTALRRAIGSQVPIIADIRDLWPDSLVPSGHEAVASAARGAGLALATELRLATGVVAASSQLLERAPSGIRWGAIPIMLPATGVDVPVRPQDAPLIATFVGSLSPLFDFDSLLEGWRAFVISQPASADHRPVLRIAGGGDREAEVRRAAHGIPGVEMLGRVPSTEVPIHLAEADVGCIPVRPGQGITLGNKAMEYLGAGLFILNSLETQIAAQLDGFGRRVPSTSAAWAEAFGEANENRATLRIDRDRRIADAEARWGRSQIEALWLEVILRALGHRTT